MVGHAVSPSLCIHLRMPTVHFSKRSCLSKNPCVKIAQRPVFFRGVATIVTKLFNIVEPDVAMFGKKDYQQWRLIKRMVRDLDFGIEIVGSDIAREKDGLAMSSRNVHLSAEDRQRALSISRSLAMAKASAEQGKIGCKELNDMIISEIVGAAGRIDYVETLYRYHSLSVRNDGVYNMQIVDQETLEGVEDIKSGVVICVAAWFGTVRLIDNIEINVAV
ncbi:hypothetical protein F2Q68_00036510 [Brassica cretica]|uniref:Pantoate--beta-alanine ligase n=1 Tax=Brassica cretica TaxID=69181 RepID=A0A8S9HB95_BRACR|nr:hypothetical protein F2Q68_00036510 [Brassica cretica]